jgi:hypothetical protein
MKPIQIITLVAVCGFFAAFLLWVRAGQRRALAFAKRYADSHGLEFSDRGDLGSATWKLASGLSRSAWGLMTGTLAGGPPLVVSYLDITARAGRSTTSLPYTVALQDVPDAGGFVQGFALSPRHGLPDGLTELPVESTEFAKRFSLGIEDSADANRVRQIFDPSVIVWLVEEAPPRTSFELRGRTLCVWTYGYLDRVERMEPFLESAAQIAARILEEAAEA